MSRAEQLVDRVFAEMLPEDKATRVRQLQREGRTVAMVSSFSSAGSKLTIGRPRVAGPPSGSFHTFRRYTLPAVEKNSTGEWVEVTNMVATASSSFVAMPARPLPPRFCARKVESGVRLM